MIELTSQNVHDAIFESLFKDDDPRVQEVRACLLAKKPLPDCAVIAEGVMKKVAFDKERLESKRQYVREMLGQLPKEFFKETGGGYTFLNGCMRSDGTQWGEQISVDSLLCLGIALDYVTILMPRDMWYLFPGSVPYFVVDLSAKSMKDSTIPIDLVQTPTQGIPQ